MMNVLSVMGFGIGLGGGIATLIHFSYWGLGACIVGALFGMIGVIIQIEQLPSAGLGPEDYYKK